MSELKQLEQRLKDVIVGTCNTTGCNGCGLKWENGCSATDLQGQIMDIELNSKRSEDSNHG